MKSLQDYKDIFRNIADNLNLQGDSVELLVQMLANATYISEVENVAYVQEASLEKAVLMNSKIQHCMNDMYSVYRGQCPRVILRFRPNKYFSFKMYEEIITSNNFSLYYLGYIPEGNGSVNYSPISIPPSSLEDETWTIMCLLATNKVTENWETGVDQYYVESTENNLSNDVVVYINNNLVNVTREMSSYILNGDSIFDLTIPSFGSRLYLPNPPMLSGNEIEATYYYYTKLTDVNQSELKKISLKGSEFVSFDLAWLTENKYSELVPGVVVIDDVYRDTLDSIHFKANRDRYVNSIIRSNSDIGTLLQELYPSKVSSTSYEFVSNEGNNILNIYYVPTAEKLTTEDKLNFLKKRESYFIANTVNVVQGTEYTVNMSIIAELYNSESPEEGIQSILNSYSGKFNIDLDSRLSEISSLISKLPNIKSVMDISLSYKDGANQVSANIADIYNNLNKSYFKIRLLFTPIIKQITA